MPEIIIPLAVKGVREAIETKEFSEAYIMDLSVRAHGMDASDQIYLEIVPFDKATGDRLLSDRREIRLPFWESVAAVPEAAAAFAAVAAAVPALIAYQEVKAAAPTVS